MLLMRFVFLWQPKSSGWNVKADTPAHMRSIWSRDYQPVTEPFKSTHDLQPIERPSTKGREVVARLSGLKLKSVKRSRSGMYFTTVLSLCLLPMPSVLLMLLVGWQEGHPACKKYGGWWRWALVSPDGMAPSRIVVVSASVNLPLHHKVQKFSSGTGSPGWSRKRVVKRLCWWCGVCISLLC